MGYLLRFYNRVLPAAAAAVGVVLGGAFSGCETAPAEARDAAPSSDVRRVTAWQDAERIAANEAGRSAAVGKGESMAPIFGDTTMLVLSRLPYAELEPGMMVAYLNQDGFQVVHRLLERTARGEWKVRGLNNVRDDRERVTPANYVGVVYASLAHEPRPASASEIVPRSDPAPPP